MAKGSILGKDPGVNWIFNDWQGGTMTFSRFLKGCYMDLLTAQFNSGHLSLDEIKTVLGSDFSAWGAIQKKFKKDANGLYYNERLEFEILKRKKFTKSRRENLGIEDNNLEEISPHMGNGNGTGKKKLDKIILKRHELFSFELLEDEAMKKSIGMQTRKEINSELLKQYTSHLHTEGKEKIDYHDFCSHLRNWLNTKPEIKNGNTGKIPDKDRPEKIGGLDKNKVTEFIETRSAPGSE